MMDTDIPPLGHLEIDEGSLTIMGVSFPDLRTLKQYARAIASNMYEGWRPTEKEIEIGRDYLLDKITEADVLKLIRRDANGI